MSIIKNPGLTLKPLQVENPKINNGFLRYKSSTDSYETILPDSQVDSTSDNIISSSAVYNYLNGGIPYITTAPTADNPNANERIILVVLYESQRASTTQYEGYWYVFVQDPPTP